MALVARSAASLRFGGDDLDPDKLTASLGREPSYSVTKGQAIIGKKTGQVRIAKTGVWILKVEDRKPGDLDAQIQELLGALTADPLVWRDLAKYKPDLFVGLFMTERNEGIDIRAETLALLASRGIDLDLDIYDPVRAE